MILTYLYKNYDKDFNSVYHLLVSVALCTLRNSANEFIPPRTLAQEEFPFILGKSQKKLQSQGKKKLTAFIFKLGVVYMNPD